MTIFLLVMFKCMIGFATMHIPRCKCSQLGTHEYFVIPEIQEFYNMFKMFYYVNYDLA
jgi:hypothetical protein